MPGEKMPLEKMRLDKWLWAARFFKTRSLATQAIEHGRVKLNGERVKPAREVKPGDRLDVHAGEVDWTLIVRGLSLLRGPAPVAQTLYEEDATSMARREQQALERKLTAVLQPTSKGRPTKRDRRQIHRFTGD